MSNVEGVPACIVFGNVCVPNVMQICVRSVVCHVDAIAAFFEVLGVEWLVDVADELIMKS